MTDSGQSLKKAALALQHEFLAVVLDNVDAYVYLKAHDGRYLYANPKVAQLYGCELEDILGRRDTDLLPPQIAAALQQTDATVLATRTRLARQELVPDTEQRPRHFWSVKMPIDLPGMPTAVIGFSTDITEMLALREQLEVQGSSDALTGLRNRTRFLAELAVDLSVAQRDRRQLAVVLMDIDQFKYINSSMGLSVGNQLLCEAAERLRAQRKGLGSLARFYGDDFALTMPDAESAEEVGRLVEQLRHILAQPYIVNGESLQLTVSAGVALFPADGQSGEVLTSRAESAMHYAKQQGRNGQQFYASEISTAVSQRLTLERDLRAAVAAHEFELHYQPKLHADGYLDSFEALLRWRRRNHGLVPPAVFIPLAEQTGLIHEIGSWVVEQAAIQMAAWREQGLGLVRVAVNLSPLQLSESTLPERLRQICHTHGLEPGQLELEVTESVMMCDPERDILILQRLRDGGINLAVDDFGTGYSSMAYLKQLPVNTLKLDRAFVTHINTDARDADICAGMIALAHKLGLNVVAEGVETDAQRQVLLQHGCDIFQGYLFSRPIPPDEATLFLRRFVDEGWLPPATRAPSL